MINFFSKIIIILCIFTTSAVSEILKKIEITGNKRISSETIIIFSEVKINDQINKAKLETDEKIKETINALQEDVSSQLSSLDKDLEKKVSDAEKEILKSKDDQMKNINNEIVNITKLTVGKITDIELSDNELNKVIETHKGSFN